MQKFHILTYMPQKLEVTNSELHKCRNHVHTEVAHTPEGSTQKPCVWIYTFKMPHT